MEGSPVTRLPEADSLPDGFVDSSATDQTPPPPASAADPPPPPIFDFDHPAAADVEKTLDASSSAVAEETLDTSSLAASVEGLQSLSLTAAPEREAEGALVEGQQDAAAAAIEMGDAKACLKESCAVEPAELLTNQKENGKPKRKVVKRSAKLGREKELLELVERYQKVLAERDAAIAVREKLESLCREFQRQNKILKEECRRVSTEGQNMRMELSEKFNNAIKDVSIKLEEQKDECISQLKENNLLRSKLKDLADQYNATQQKYAQQLKEKMLKLELADLEIQQHQEKSVQEQTQMQLYAEQVSQLITTEKTLRLQLAADGERFQQFQDALSKSNEVFETYKQEMEKMVKLIKELKEENEFFKGKCESSDIALVKLIEERELTKKQLDKLKNQKEKLESLCRSLQAERKQGSSSSSADASSKQADLASQGSLCF